MFGIFDKRQKIRELAAELEVARNWVKEWRDKYQTVVEACLKNDAQVREHLETVYKGKYFKFELFDPEKNQVILHKMLIDSVDYNGGIITFNVHEKEISTNYRTTFGCLHNFKQISKKTYLS